MIHPATKDFLQTAARHPGFQSLLQKLTRAENGPFTVSGLVTTAKALYTVLLYQATEKPILLLVDGNKEAEAISEAVGVFFGLLFEGRDLPEPQLLPALDVMPHQRMSPHSEISEARATARDIVSGAESERERINTEIRRLRALELDVKADYRAFLMAALDRLEGDTQERPATDQAA